MKAKCRDYPRVFFTLTYAELDGTAPQELQFAQVQLPNGVKTSASDVTFLGRTPNNDFNFMGFLKLENLLNIKPQ